MTGCDCAGFKASKGLCLQDSGGFAPFFAPDAGLSCLRVERLMGYGFGLRGSREASVRTLMNEAKACVDWRGLKAEGERSHDAVGSIGG